jgi:hypothetical protein
VDQAGLQGVSPKNIIYLICLVAKGFPGMWGSGVAHSLVLFGYKA